MKESGSLLQKYFVIFQARGKELGILAASRPQRVCCIALNLQLRQTHSTTFDWAVKSILNIAANVVDTALVFLGVAKGMG